MPQRSILLSITMSVAEYDFTKEILSSLVLSRAAIKIFKPNRKQWIVLLHHSIEYTNEIMEVSNLLPTNPIPQYIFYIIHFRHTYKLWHYIVKSTSSIAIQTLDIFIFYNKNIFPVRNAALQIRFVSRRHAKFWNNDNLWLNWFDVKKYVVI